MYAGFDIENNIGQAPKLRIKSKLAIPDFSEYEEPLIYVDKITCEVCLYSTFSDFSNHHNEGSIGKYDIFVSSVYQPNSAVSADIPIEVNSELIERMLDLRAEVKVVGLLIDAKIVYHVYQKASLPNIPGPTLLLNKISQWPCHVRKTMPDGEIIEKILFSSEEFASIIKGIKHVEVIRIEIPLSTQGSITNVYLRKAADLMLASGRAIEKGNNEAVLLNTRNAILNQLTELATVTGKAERHVRLTIKQEVLQNAPAEALNMYREVLERVEDQLLAALQIIHKFVHEDTGRLKLTPLNDDIEYVYFNVALIIKYLSKQLQRHIIE
jgi:hypothetical protein